MDITEEHIDINPTDAVMNCHRRLYKAAGRLAHKGAISAEEYSEFRIVFKDVFSIRRSIIVFEKGCCSSVTSIDDLPAEAVRLLKKTYPNADAVRLSQNELDRILHCCYDVLRCNYSILMDHLRNFYERFSAADSTFGEDYYFMKADLMNEGVNAV